MKQFILKIENDEVLFTEIYFETSFKIREV
jgi:hypothetical protein